MAYTKTNMRRTLETAKQYLKAGFIKGEWICRLDEVDPNDKKGRTCKHFCCAEGAIALAAGQREVHSNADLTDYAQHVLSLVNEKVMEDPNRMNNSIMAINDAGTSRYRDVEKYFNRAIKELS